MLNFVQEGKRGMGRGKREGDLKRDG